MISEVHGRFFGGELGSLRQLVQAEWAAGIFGLKLFISCIALAAFMMGTVWGLGGGLTAILERGGKTFLGGDVSVSTNVPLPVEIEDQIAALGAFSRIAEFRSSGRAAEGRAAIEVKAVDNAYPLYGAVSLESGLDLQEVLSAGQAGEGLPAAIVEPSFLTTTGSKIGDTLIVGDLTYRIADSLILEPDRLSAGRFLVGPRVLIPFESIEDQSLVQTGAIVDYRYRVRADLRAVEDVLESISSLRPESGWEFETPQDAGDRALRVVERTTTFLGIAGIVAMMIGIAGAGAGAKAWIQRRTRTIALYRLSGADPGTVASLHAVILASASLFGALIGLSIALGLVVPLLDSVTHRLHVEWTLADLLYQYAIVALLLAFGLLGVGVMAVTGILGVAPGAAMRSGEAGLKISPRHAAISIAVILLSFALAALSLPIADLAILVALGFLSFIALLAGFAYVFSRVIARRSPTSFTGMILHQTLGEAEPTVMRAISIGVGVIGITAIIAAQTSLTSALTQELPERVPDLALIDVQPSQIEAIREIIDADPNLGGVQADPMMRMTITHVNDLPAEEALVLDNKSWVIEGDRSFSWTAEPTGAELLQGTWWEPDYDGPPLLSPEEDVMEAFDLKVGDTVTYSVLGRSFTSEVVNIRKEYHRTFRPEYLMMASPNPFKNAPQTWVVSLQGETQTAIDLLIRRLAQDYPNVTSIDIRPIVEQVTGVVEGATLGIFAIAALLVIAGALTVAALVASDVDARRREALVFSLIGASRTDVARVRLVEAAAIGGLAALVGGLGGLGSGYIVTVEGLRIDWAPTYIAFVIPVALGILASVIAGLIGGFGAIPKGRGQITRILAA